MTPEQVVLLKELHTYAQKNHNTCWCIPWEEGEFLYFLVTHQKPKYILEIGTSLGFSTLWLAIAANHYGGTIKTLEINEERAVQAKNNFKKAKVNNVTILKGDANCILKELHAPFDFIFFDAGKEHYLEQIKILEKNGCIRNGTLIVADNTKIIHGKKNDQLHAYLDYMRTRYVSLYIPFENGLEVSLKEPHAN